MANPSNPGLYTPRKHDKNKDDCIINRRREYRGLTGSFSSNLGQRTSAQPCREPKTKGCTNGFVKALVAKLESSDDRLTMSSVSNVSIDSSSSRSKQPASPASSTSPDCSYQQSPVNNLPTVAGVEGYSLTLLKYQQYFASKPLGRCLDEQENTSNSCQTRVISRSGPDGTPTPEASENKLISLNEESQDIRSQPGSVENTPHSNNYAHTEGAPISFGETQLQDGAVAQRDPEEVKAFWAHVRQYLSASDDELENLEAQGIVDGNKAKSLNNREVLPRFVPSDHFYMANSNLPSKGASSPTPHRKANSAPNVETGVYFSPRQRRRFLSVEEKMVEIDAFFEIDDNVDELIARRT